MNEQTTTVAPKGKHSRSILIAFAWAGSLLLSSLSGQTLSYLDSIEESPAPTNFGDSLAIDGDTLVVGQGDRNTSFEPGSVYIYERVEGAWTLEQQIFPDVRSNGDGFGHSVAIANGLIAVGAPNEFTTPIGYVYLFEKQNGVWTQIDRLEPSPGSDSFSKFGIDLTFNEDQLFVSWVNDNDVSFGKLYVFEENNGSWEIVQEMDFDATHSAITNRWGARVPFGVEGDTLLVGFPSTNSSQGEVKVLKKVEGTWTESQTLTASDGTSGDWFGFSMSIYGNRAAIVAIREDVPPNSDFTGIDVGAIYIFEQRDGSWEETDKLTPPTIVRFGRGFGGDVWLNEDQLIANQGEGFGIYPLLAYAFPAGKAAFVDEVDQFRDEHYVNDIVRDSDGVIYLSVEPAFGYGSGPGYIERYGFDVSNGEIILNLLSDALFPNHDDPVNGLEPEEAAFRYIDSLYKDVGGVAEVDFEAFESNYGIAEAERVRQAVISLDRYSSIIQGNEAYSNLLLDVYYYRAQAEVLRANRFLLGSAQDRLGPPFSDPAADEWVIDLEIASHQEALEKIRTALERYFELFALNEGTAEDAAIRKQILIDASPGREFKLPQAIIDTQDPTDPETLFDGYKDLVLVFQILQKYGETAQELGRLQIANGQREDAIATISSAQRSLFFHGNLMLSLFPELDPDTVTGSGLSQAIAAWKVSIGNLDNAISLARSDENILGFTNDFLMLTQRATRQQTQDFIYDSYDVFKQFLDKDDSESPLRAAIDSQADAIDSYETIRNNADDLAEQYTSSTVSYESRLFEIVGALPGEPGYDDPGSIEGSDIWQQLKSIEGARLRVRKNTVEINNLVKEINIEVERSGDVQAAVIKYGDKQAKLTQSIAHVQAAQSFFDKLLNPVELTKAAFGLGLINGLIQAGGEELKGKYEGDKEQLAAAETAEIEGINSAAYVKTLWLQMNVLRVETEEAFLLYRQELGRAKALLREKAFIERRIAERDDSFAKRYYADPIHQLIADNAYVIAENDFNTAQLWMFYTVRALEYKWNKTFNFFDGSKTWDLSSVFRSRNATELTGLYDATVIFNESFENTTIEDDRYDWFSVKQDFMGFRIRIQQTHCCIGSRCDPTGDQMAPGGSST